MLGSGGVRDRPCADHRIVVVQDGELTARDAEHGLGEVERKPSDVAATVAATASERYRTLTSASVTRTCRCPRASIDVTARRSRAPTVTVFVAASVRRT